MEEKIKDKIVSFLSFVTIKPDDMDIEVEIMGKSRHIFIQLYSSCREDVGRLLGKGGKNKLSLKKVIGMMLRVNGFLDSIDSFELRILNK